MNRILKIYTDGSCLKNPGKGGFAICIVHSEKEEVFAKGEIYTTNNRMELQAVIFAFEKSIHIQQKIEIYSDSMYVINGFNEWMEGWSRKDWTRSGKPLLNKDLWQILFKYKENYKHYSLHWVKGHSNDFYNDLVDRAANEAAQNM